MAYQLLNALNHLKKKNERDIKYAIFSNLEFTEFYFRSDSLYEKIPVLRTCGRGDVLEMAPEILFGRSWKNVTSLSWLIGNTCFAMITGNSPFKTDGDVFWQIGNGNTNFDEKFWENLPGNPKSLIKALLDVNPARRPSPEQSLGHSWFVESLEWTRWQNPSDRWNLDPITKQEIYAMLLVNQRSALFPREILFKILSFVIPPRVVPLSPWKHGEEKLVSKKEKKKLC